ncbi:MAG TPA: flagellar export protein FliJ [Solirubrobacteraceae bacterium]|nr:flagellar export protein FliJ [Solirubrobacteraceae bacterium]
MTGPSFRFRLERVRAVRERKEDVAKQELAQAVVRLSNSRAKLLSAQADEESARAAQRLPAGEGTLTASELIARQAFLERVEAERIARMRDLSRSEAEVAQRDAALTVASSEHEMLKRLRERHRGEHDRELARREGIQLDEMATTRYHGSAA